MACRKCKRDHDPDVPTVSLAVWTWRIRDTKPKPPPEQLAALWMLASRLDAKTGCGWATVDDIADLTGVSRWTVQRATKWAQDHFLLLRRVRGHHVTGGHATGSLWWLLDPSQRGTAATLGAEPTGQPKRANGAADPHPTGQPTANKYDQISKTKKGAASGRPSGGSVHTQGTDRARGQAENPGVRRGRRPNPKTPEKTDAEQFRVLFEQGLSAKEIADASDWYGVEYVTETLEAMGLGRDSPADHDRRASE